MKRSEIKKAASQIRRVLKDDWDPIGFWTPPDEYDDYVWRLLGLISEGADRERIIQRLQVWSDVVMQCPVAPEKTSLVADKIMSIDFKFEEDQA